MKFKSGVKSNVPLCNPIIVTKLPVILSCCDPFWVFALLKNYSFLLIIFFSFGIRKKSGFSVFRFRGLFVLSKFSGRPK